MTVPASASQYFHLHIYVHLSVSVKVGVKIDPSFPPSSVLDDNFVSGGYSLSPSSPPRGWIGEGGKKKSLYFSPPLPLTVGREKKDGFS